MLYQTYNVIQKNLEVINKIAASNVTYSKKYIDSPFVDYSFLTKYISRTNLAYAKMTERLSRNYRIPEWNIDSIEHYEVKYQDVKTLPFCNLKKISIDKKGNKKNPVLLVSPMSGHYSTLLRETVRELLINHDVYITEWIDASEVPCEEGNFGLEEFIGYIVHFAEIMPKNYSIIAVCQPTVAVAVAAGHISRKNASNPPYAIVFMGGPMVLDGSENDVSELGIKKNHRWFKDTLIYEVPYGKRGAGRSVYPGFIQLSAFISMNMDKHIKKHSDLFFDTIFERDTIRTEEFYDEYFAVMDLDAKFYLETIDIVFRRRLLEKGQFPYRGEMYGLEDIASSIKVMSIEGENDDIAAVGQTSNAVRRMTQIPDNNKALHVFGDVGHYGIFSGKKWQSEIRPIITQFVSK